MHLMVLETSKRHRVLCLCFTLYNAHDISLNRLYILPKCNFFARSRGRARISCKGCLPYRSPVPRQTQRSCRFAALLQTPAPFRKASAWPLTLRWRWDRPLYIKNRACRIDRSPDNLAASLTFKKPATCDQMSVGSVRGTMKVPGFKGVPEQSECRCCDDPVHIQTHRF